MKGLPPMWGAGASLQKAKVGYCVCCSKITHVAVPPNYPTGSYVETKCMGTTLWQTKGPWAGRALAAHQYWNWYGALSASRDWAARSMDIQAPSPLLFLHVRGTEPETKPQKDAPSKPQKDEPTNTLLDRPPRRPRDGSHSRTPRMQEPVASKPSPPQPVTPTESRYLSAFEVMDTSPPRRQVTP